MTSRTAGDPWCLPRYDERFEPLGAWRAEAFGFQVLSAAGPRVKPLLVELRDEVLHALRSTSLPEDVFYTLIAELRRVGHDLWSVEAKSNGECWSSDYMRWAEGRGLYLDFNWGPPIRLVRHRARRRDERVSLASQGGQGRRVVG